MKPYYEQDGIQIWHGDCREILPTLGRGCYWHEHGLGGCLTCEQDGTGIQHVITDPPYSEHTHAKQWIGAALTSDGKPRVSTAHKALGFDALTDEMLAYCACEFSRLARRWTLVFSDVESAHHWRDGLAIKGLDYVRTCFWDKVDSAPQFTGDRPAAACEAIVCAHQTGKKSWNGGGRRNVFRYAVNGESGPKPHPSTKPLPLMRELVSLFTDPGETILDPFMGSGTTLRAAKDLGRKAIGIELEEKWCEVAAKRMSQSVLPLYEGWADNGWMVKSGYVEEPA